MSEIDDAVNQVTAEYRRALSALEQAQFISTTNYRAAIRPLPEPEPPTTWGTHPQVKPITARPRSIRE